MTERRSRQRAESDTGCGTGLTYQEDSLFSGIIDTPSKGGRNIKNHIFLELLKKLLT